MEKNKMKQLMDAEMIKRSLKRMSHEILERNNGVKDIVIVGIKTRGEFLGYRIAENLFDIEEVKVPVIAIDVKMYRDDIDNQKPIIDAINFNFKDKIVVLVDDVLFKGRTARAGIECVMSHGRARMIQLAVLIDRGHRELPIKPDYVGKNIPTSLSENVKCNLLEIDDDEGVYITIKSKL